MYQMLCLLSNITFYFQTLWRLVIPRVSFFEIQYWTGGCIIDLVDCRQICENM